MDFFMYLDTDMVLNVMTRLDDPADLVRASIVSRHWGDFVISRGLCRKLCVRKFPILANDCVGSSSSTDQEVLSRHHRFYSSLLYAIEKLRLSSPRNCILEGISSSSATNPEDDISYMMFGGLNHWSSKGEKDPNIPETLIYKLESELSLITGIEIMPYGDRWEGAPKETYSASSVRFKMGYPKTPRKEFQDNYRNLPNPADDHFVWEYTSPWFKMSQEDELQRFKFEEPVLCIGGFVMIELLGRVRQRNGLYYIKIENVRIMGRSLSPAFDAKLQDSTGKFVLYFNAAKLGPTIYGAAMWNWRRLNPCMRHKERYLSMPPSL